MNTKWKTGADWLLADLESEDVRNPSAEVMVDLLLRELSTPVAVSWLSTLFDVLVPHHGQALDTAEAAINRPGLQKLLHYRPIRGQTLRLDVRTTRSTDTGTLIKPNTHL